MAVGQNSLFDVGHLGRRFAMPQATVKKWPLANGVLGQKAPLAENTVPYHADTLLHSFARHSSHTPIP